MSFPFPIFVACVVVAFAAVAITVNEVINEKLYYDELNLVRGARNCMLRAVSICFPDCRTKYKGNVTVVEAINESEKCYRHEVIYFRECMIEGGFKYPFNETDKCYRYPSPEMNYTGYSDINKCILTCLVPRCKDCQQNCPNPWPTDNFTAELDRRCDNKSVVCSVPNDMY